MVKLKLLINFFVMLLLIGVSTNMLKAQSSCPVFIPKPATFVSVNKTLKIEDGSTANVSTILDGEGKTGLPSDGKNGVSYWMKADNPVTFFINMNSPSTISRVKFYSAWGFDEGAKNVIVRLYNGATLLGTENIVLPYLYKSGYVAIFGNTYTNVTKVQLVIVNDYGTNFALRTSLTEIVFGDTICDDKDGDAVADYLDLDDDNDGIKDIDENCSGFLAQNTSGVWKGKTGSNLTATLTAASTQVNVHDFSDGQIHYYINEMGGEPRYHKLGNVSFTYSFSTPVPANEIAFWVHDIDPSNGSTNATVTFKINGGDPNGNFTATDYGQNPLTYLNYNTITGVMSSPSSGLDDQRLIIKGVGNTLVSTITITSSGVSATDDVAYSLFALNPCDTDSDGIPNTFDLDSDGDGCTDAIEGAGNFTSSQLTAASGTLNTQVPNQNFGVSVDANGIPTTVGTAGQGVGQSQDSTKNDCIDTDGDGVPDWQDLDDDNDGILDTVECGNSITIPDLSVVTWTPINGGNLSDILLGKVFVASNYFTLNGNTYDLRFELISKYPVSGTGSTFTASLDPRVGIIGGVSSAQSHFTYNLSLVKAGTVTSTNLAGIKEIFDDVKIEIFDLDNGTVGRTDIGGFVNPIPSVITKGSQISAYTLNNGQVSYGLTNINISQDIPNPNTDMNYSITGEYANFSDATLLLGTYGTVTTAGGDRRNYMRITVRSCANNDTDEDGIPDYLDLDSDGDGCSDAIEGAGNFTSSQLTTASGTLNTQTPNQNFGVAVDANGIPTTVGTAGQGVGQSQDSTKNDCIDTDGDGVPNWQDLDNDNDGIVDTDECGSTDRISNGTFPTSGGNTNTLAGWSVGGTYAASGAWSSPTGRINLNSNGLEFRRDASTVTTISQNLTGVTSGATINLNNVYWNKTQTNDATSRSVLDISYGGIIYATIDSTFGDTPTVIAKNGASVNINALPSVTTTSIPISGVLSTKTNITINLPYNVVNSGTLLFTFNAGTSSNNVRDLGIQSVTLFSCKDTDGDGIPDYLDLDSDNDGCPDAVEGGANLALSQLVTAGGTLQGGNGINPVVTPTSGTYNQAILQNLCNTTTCVDVNGVPIIVNGGQSVGTSENAGVKAAVCSFCYKPAITTGTSLPTNHGITSLGRAGADNGNWPMIRKGAWTALEAKTKGFVINRIAITASVEAIANPVEGMMVYDEEADCLKINTDGTTTGWKCFNTQACPD